jgi:hypothetical protein
MGLWDENLYWHTGGADRLRFYRRSFSEWQSLGLDRHSLVADPQFVDAGNRDFRLKPGSPALGLGFQPFDVRGVGLYGDLAWAGEAGHARCRVHPLPPPPPPPQPLEIDDDFEMTPVGRHPAHAHVSGEEQGASIVVSDERAAGGKHSLKVRDSKTLRPSWQPHFYYEPHITAGTVLQSFDVWMEKDAEFFTEWRDAAEYPRNVGPSVQLDGTGNVRVGGKTLAIVPSGQWVHVQIEARLGKGAPRTFRLTLIPSGGPGRVFENLPMSGDQFAELHWLGFSSTATQDTTFFLDNLKIRKAGGR